MDCYDYSHRNGVQDLTWEGFAALTRSLAESLAREHVEVIVGIARAGLFPAAAVAGALRRELFPVRVTRRVDDRIVYPSPVWKVPVLEAVTGRTVAVVDELADTGETLRLVADETRRYHAARVISAALVAHSWATPQPDIVALESDAFVVFPWNREIFDAGRWAPHPDLIASVSARQRRGLEGELDPGTAS